VENSGFVKVCKGIALYFSVDPVFKCLATCFADHEFPNFIRKGPKPLLWIGSRTEAVKITISGASKGLH
jgi:hypothetical protein